MDDQGHISLSDKLHIRMLITGVGVPFTIARLLPVLGSQSWDLVVNAGIAGSFRRDLPLGEVVQVQSERFADLGVEEADGSFTDVFEMGLIESGQSPFQNGLLINPTAGDQHFLPSVSGLTVNKVHGYPPSIDQIQKKYPADIESMEGAGFFLACLESDVNFLEIRSISNYVEARRRENWNLALSINNLNQTLQEMLQAMQ
jgi:futalosine hydrolase